MEKYPTLILRSVGKESSGQPDQDHICRHRDPALQALARDSLYTPGSRKCDGRQFGKSGTIASFRRWAAHSTVRQTLIPVPKKLIPKGPASLPANDNKAPVGQEILDFLRVLIPQDDAAADAICRRGERTAHVVFVVMCICLVAVPLIFAGVFYAGVAVVP
ncbi:hypothetical protein LGH82_29565 [Mesorhizobium sp. PAMC28654]|uniref:hypothetical protein n=1 Tax=Mesorhizobium sp. PAMC28654 TaxID=2880934 RepID=UPI001D09C5B5|nr:hypothetical protein [Mesorhizobium sp. PAMC28654]UDL89174.1 hypothetical protein LGH82_29565 [Mesorhizobium sp. PAMC28654]